MTKEERFKKWQEGHKRWLADPKNREHLSKKNQEFWESEEGEKLKKVNSKRNRKWWRDRPDDEFVLGERIPQRLNGKRNEEGYRDYMARFQARWRASHPNYYKYLQRYRKDKKNGKFNGTFKEWQKANGVEA